MISFKFCPCAAPFTGKYMSAVGFLTIQSAQRLSTMQWFKKKIGSLGEVIGDMEPPIHTCPRLCSSGGLPSHPSSLFLKLGLAEVLKGTLS